MLRSHVIFFYVLTCCGLLAFATSPSGSLSVRLRLESGVVQRLGVNATESVATLTERIAALIDSADLQLTIQGQTYEIDELRQNLTRVGDTSIKNGDFVLITSPNDKQSSNEASDSAVSSSTIPKKSMPKKFSARKQVASVEDIRKRKEGMEKIKRQLVNSSHGVEISPSVARIVHRVTEKGGMALLLGRNDTTNSAEPRKRSINRSKHTKACESTVHVVAAVEVHSGSFGFPSDLRNLATTRSAVELAHLLHLQVVGACVGAPNELATESINAKTRKKVNNGGQREDINHGSAWSVRHVHAALQVLSLPGARDGAVIVSAVPASAASAVDSDKRARSRRRASVDGVVLEAFQLSEQALRLHATGLLLDAPLAAHDDASVLVRLNSAVLVRSDEVNEVDPYLLAVPIAIRASTGGVKAASPLLLAHSFPTPDELLDAHTRSVAQGFLLRLLRNVADGVTADDATTTTMRTRRRRRRPKRAATSPTSAASPSFANACLTPGTAARLRDPHLLLHLESLMPKPAFESLCHTLSLRADAATAEVDANGAAQTDDDQLVLPFEIAMALEATTAQLAHVVDAHDSNSDDDDNA